VLEKIPFGSHQSITRGDRHLIVSNGAGNWFPLRTKAPAKIIRLTLRPT